MATLTTVYEFFLPVVGGDIDKWGGFHNQNFELLDDLLSGVQGITPDLVNGWKVGGVAVTSSAAELNLLDGLTASTAELNVLDGYTGTTADLNLLTGAAAGGLTAAELMFVNGVTSAIQTQLDAKLATAAYPTLVSLEGLALAAGDLLYATAADTLARLAKGTARQALTMNTAETAPNWEDLIGASATQALTGASPIDFSGVIPSWAKEIIISIKDASLDGNGLLYVQARTAAGAINTGYSAYSDMVGVRNTGVVTVGFPIELRDNARDITGNMILVKHGASNTWVASHAMFMDSGNAVVGAGSVALAAALTGIRITLTGGNNFDGSGTASITWK